MRKRYVEFLHTILLTSDPLSPLSLVKLNEKQRVKLKRVEELDSQS